MILRNAMNSSNIANCVRTDNDIHDAVRSWCANISDAETRYCNIRNWKTSEVTNMDALFANFHQGYTPRSLGVNNQSADAFCDDRNFQGNIRSWDVSRVTSMSYMFANQHRFNSDLSRWDVGNVRNMMHMFRNAKLFSGNLSNWNVAKVTKMNSMFKNAEAFDSDLSRWNVGNVEQMGHMFQRTNRFNTDLSKWDVRNVTYMATMFYVATNFAQDLGDWKLNPNVETSTMFSYSRSECVLERGGTPSTNERIITDSRFYCEDAECLHEEYEDQHNDDLADSVYRWANTEYDYDYNYGYVITSSPFCRINITLQKKVYA